MYTRMTSVRGGLWQEIGMGVFLLVFVAAPAFLLAGGSEKVYVDKNASGSEDGTSSHPYHTISEALKHADEGDEVHIRKGNYRDNLDIPKGVEIYGSDKEEVVIEAKKGSKAVAVMRHKSKLDGVTLKGGKYGVWVKENARVSIIDCNIRKNSSDGIYAEGASVDDKHALSVTESEIRYNGKNGISSQKRRVILIENNIEENKNDGVELALGSSAWIDNNSMKENGGSGIRLTLDGSKIYIASKNSIRSNSREGIEVNSFGGFGTINIKKSCIVENDRYAVARVQRVASVTNSVWSGLAIEDNNTFFENHMGNISPIVRGF